MPQMMPMMWLLMYISTLFFIFLLTAMIYFFYLPQPSRKKTPKYLHKWNWTW